MAKNICAAVSEDIALGLSLAGVNDILVYSKSINETEVKEWFGRKIREGVSIMVLSRDCGDVLSDELFQRRISGEMLPITVLIPEDEEDRRAADLIKRAIGMVPQQKEND